MSKVAIRIDGVSKDFVLPHLRKSTVKSVFTGIFDLGRKKRNAEVQHALHNISFEINEGEFFGIVGRNGSGKSTLLKILAGIYQPSKGKVSIAPGKLVPFIELGVGFNPELSGRDNVYLNGALLGFSEKQIDDLYDDIVEFAELEKFMDQKLKNYSSGMQVRLAFSMAVRADADILLVDEVLAVGDADFQRKCFEYFRELKKNKKTVVFVSHDMSAVREYCDRAVMIEKSKLVVAGTATAVATEYTKMFTPKSDKVGKGSDTRWGDKSVEFTDVKVNKLVNIGDPEVKISLSYKANKAVKKPIFGILIKNSVGTHLTGTNTDIKKIKVGDLKEGETGTISWKVPNIFNDGKYFVDIAATNQDGITQYDWWEDALGFDVYRDDKTPYAINPPIEIKLKN